MACNPPIGVLLSPGEIHHLMIMLQNLRADDLVMEDHRQRALATVYRLYLDCHRVHSQQAPVSTGDAD